MPRFAFTNRSASPPHNIIAPLFLAVVVTQQAHIHLIDVLRFAAEYPLRSHSRAHTSFQRHASVSAFLCTSKSKCALAHKSRSCTAPQRRKSKGAAKMHTAARKRPNAPTHELGKVVRSSKVHLCFDTQNTRETCTFPPPPLKYATQCNANVCTSQPYDSSSTIFKLYAMRDSIAIIIKLKFVRHGKRDRFVLN